MKGRISHKETIYTKWVCDRSFRVLCRRALVLAWLPQISDNPDRTNQLVLVLWNIDNKTESRQLTNKYSDITSTCPCFVLY